MFSAAFVSRSISSTGHAPAPAWLLCNEAHASGSCLSKPIHNPCSTWTCYIRPPVRRGTATPEPGQVSCEGTALAAYAQTGHIQKRRRASSGTTPSSAVAWLFRAVCSCAIALVRLHRPRSWPFLQVSSSRSKPGKAKAPPLFGQQLLHHDWQRLMDNLGVVPRTCRAA